MDKTISDEEGLRRIIPQKEIKQRGCIYCKDYNGKCPHDICPYRELDSIKNYELWADEIFLFSDIYRLEMDICCSNSGSKN